MKPILLSLLLLLAALPIRKVFGADAGSTPRTIFVEGSITNTTAEIASVARLELVIEGETAKATLRTEPPLSGSGQLVGRMRGGWCELSGKLSEGFVLHLRGAINERDFRGTYTAEIPGSPIQYGKFHFTVRAAGR